MRLYRKIETVADAHMAKLDAQQMRADPDAVLADHILADCTDRAADALLTLDAEPERGTGGELIPTGEGCHNMELVTRRPDRTALVASQERLELARDCGAIEMACEAAEDVKARNALERMLTHQMAALHKAAMGTLAKSGKQTDTIEQARLANAAARLIGVFQDGMLTLQRVRGGGQQTVTVQHVQVSQGGQAVVAGTMATGGSRVRGRTPAGVSKK